MTDPRKLGGRLGNQMFQLAFLLAGVHNGSIPDIYVQDMRYWENIQGLVRSWFVMGIEKDGRVALHVRRGDYLNTVGVYADLCETDYYERAIAEFPDSRFLVFCHDGQNKERDKEDMQWCRNTFTGDRFDFREARDEITDLNAMAGCKGIIMANSTFSWWAAFLGPEKKVIAPHQWFVDRPHITYPDSWKVL